MPENCSTKHESAPHVSITREFLASLPTLPGVYRMIDASDAVLYVGKAKDLKKRVSSYFQKNDQSPRIRLMLKSVARIDTTITRTEAEALLLENNLIKGLKPRFNILFRDDKSYPYLLLTGHRYPRLAYFRGTPKKTDQAFGPYPNSYAVRESIQLLQKVFQLRSCEDTVFANRSRPCLLHQIRRCTAPCVDAIAPDAYARDVAEAAQLLRGEASALTETITAQMNAAAEQLDFETAAFLRDRLRMLATVREKQFVDTTGSEADADVVAVAEAGGVIAVNLTMIRGGRHLGDRSFYPQHGEGATLTEALEAFIAQHYLGHPIPPHLLISEAIKTGALETLLSDLAQKKISVLHRVTAQRRVWLTMALANARLSAERRSSERAHQTQRLAALADTLDLPALKRIECFDISHTMGEATIASNVVYEGDDLKKADYRRYNITGITPGDDYAAMRAALTKRFHKSVEENGVLPDLLLIDGGKGQISSAVEAMAELGLSDVLLLGVAKGESRKPGLETLIFADGRELKLAKDHPGFHLIQQVRDEAHRFAITGHRAKRGKVRMQSTLEDIPGIGPRRRKQLLEHFGGLQGVRDAGVDALASVNGISRELAETLYAALH
ncbi:MAG: excinuclease ABC subunit C [Hydrogenophilales bacterium 16-64-46]|nr:MAG: excinuclease ABC subunit C [Hydrogenophilales bacterium 12-64-13]OYZ05509.1 MAG: excinuclease ABC subunit C [Hydrogenophilales bacterium 16-64-46]OZA40089.1 MAG: excinuclease ABC subunit C [Hydrogenophilales bacterium 17-64-34]